MSDLRSQIIKDACDTIQIFSSELGQKFIPMAKLILPHLLNVAGSGNTVIKKNIVNCLFAVIENTEIPLIFKQFLSILKETK